MKGGKTMASKEKGFTKYIKKNVSYLVPVLAIPAVPAGVQGATRTFTNCTATAGAQDCTAAGKPGSQWWLFCNST